MAEDKKPFWRELLPHAVWDGIKEIVKRLGLASLGGAVIAALAALWEKARHLSPDWYFIGGLFTVSCLVLALLLYIARKGSPVRIAEITGIVEELLIKKGLSAQNQTQLKNATAGLKEGQRTESEHPAVFDAEIYRIATSGKAMSEVVELTRSLYETMKRVDEFAIDADVLMEMYVVNMTDRTQYLRDITATVEVDGKTLPLIRQNDFYAWEFNGEAYEYCLNPSDDQLDRSQLKTLAPLCGRLPLNIEARQPLEGWIHFVLKNIDPYKLRDNRTYKLFLVDSLGKEHPILKASAAQRSGQISARPTTHR